MFITENVYLTSTIVVAIHNVIYSVVCLSFRFRTPPPASKHCHSKTRSSLLSRRGGGVSSLENFT